jgi:hypothetical protein
MASRPARVDALRHQRLHAGQQHVAREGGLARAGHAGDGDQALEGDGRADVLQVVQMGPVQGQPAHFILFLVFFASSRRRMVFLLLHFQEQSSITGRRPCSGCFIACSR